MESVETLIFGLYVFILAAFVGYQLITNVPNLLHTPLMAATNAISGISLVGSMVAAGANHDLVEPHHPGHRCRGCRVGERGRRLHDHRSHAAHVQEAHARLRGGVQRGRQMSPELSLAYLVASVLFILCLRGLELLGPSRGGAASSSASWACSSPSWRRWSTKRSSPTAAS